MSKFWAAPAMALLLVLVPAAAQNLAAKHSTPTERLYADIDAQRLLMVRSLIGRLIPNCHPAASEADLAAYRGYRARLGAPAQGTGAARAAVETWKMYHCVATYFDSQRYYLPPGYEGGDVDLAYPEPVGALGRFFQAANAQGLLKFPTEQESDYFFDRYTSLAFSSSWDAERSISWFRRAPWLP